jgi:hypothetical protein
MLKSFTVPLKVEGKRMYVHFICTEQQWRTQKRQEISLLNTHEMAHNELTNWIKTIEFWNSMTFLIKYKWEDQKKKRVWELRQIKYIMEYNVNEVDGKNLLSGFVLQDPWY